jgi:hypothetical protein
VAPLAAGLAGPLHWGHHRINITYPELLNAQLRLGVYPGGGWNVDEMNWRLYSFLIGFERVAIAGIGIPAAAVAPGPDAVPVALAPVVGAANLPPSPVALGVDSTELGQIGYHIGTAAGGHLACCMDSNGPAGTLWYFFHLSRALSNGGAFTFANGMRPDIVGFSVHPGTGVWHSLVVWENKGHCNNAGIVPLDHALDQANSITHCNMLPGGVPAAGLGWGAWAPDAWVASMVDLFHGHFRVQIGDPIGEKSEPRTYGQDGLNKFLKVYYEPFVEIIRKKSTRRVYYGKSFYTVELARGVVLGLDADIYSAFGSSKLSASVAMATLKGYRNDTPQIVWVDQTGISVEVSKDWPKRS